MKENGVAFTSSNETRFGRLARDGGGNQCVEINVFRTRNQSAGESHPVDVKSCQRSGPMPHMNNFLNTPDLARRTPSSALR